jgi:peptide deformylase
MEEFIKYPNALLTNQVKNFDFTNPPTNPSELVEQMLKIMQKYNGVGLSANQLGLPYRVFVMRGLEHNFACFNPRIVSHSNDTTILEEGCLSFPGVTVKVKRYNEVRLRFTTASGGTDTKTFSGITARVIQHEIDHLNGILFFNRANRYHRDKALKGFYNGKNRNERKTSRV